MRLLEQNDGFRRIHSLFPTYDLSEVGVALPRRLMVQVGRDKELLGGPRPQIQLHWGQVTQNLGAKIKGY